MPVTKTAKRALRNSKAKKSVNDKLITQTEISIRKAKKSPTDKNLKEATSLLDRAVKRKIYHKNKVARLKSSLSKLLKPKTSQKTPKGK